MQLINPKYTYFLAAFFVAFLAGVVSAQGTVTGRWNAAYKDLRPNKIHFAFERDDQKEKNQMGNSVELKRLSGISLEQIKSDSGPVSFSISSEAGDISMNGSFSNLKGTGTFVFTPNSAFLARSANLGLKDPDGKELFASAVLDVKLGLVGELRNSNIAISDIEDLFKATIFDINGAYVDEMSAAGFAELELEDLVKTRIFKIDAGFVRDVKSMGFEDSSIEDLVKFRIFKVTPEFLESIRGEGYSDLTTEQVVKMRIFKIDSAFIQAQRANGKVNLSVEELVRIKIHGR